MKSGPCIYAKDNWAGYDRITGKGIYVFINPEEISGYLNRYHNTRIFVRTRAENEEHRQKLVKEYSKDMQEDL